MFHSGAVEKSQVARVAEDPVVALVVVPPVEANAFRLPPLVVVVFLQGLVAEAAPPANLVVDRWSFKYTSARLLEQTYKTQSHNSQAHTNTCTISKGPRLDVLGVQVPRFFQHRQAAQTAKLLISFDHGLPHCKIDLLCRVVQ